MEGYIAEVRLWAGTWAPRTWAFCHGQSMAINTNTALFSLIGTIYGGDGRTTFKLPDTRSRVVISAGQGTGLSNYRIGQIGGAETVTLNTQQIPSHNHVLVPNLSAHIVPPALEDSGTSKNPNGANFAIYDGSAKVYAGTSDSAMAIASGTISGDVTADNAGGSQPHNNLQPMQALHYIICLQGLFPSRN